MHSPSRVKAATRRPDAELVMSDLALALGGSMLAGVPLGWAIIAWFWRGVGEIGDE